MGILSGIFKSRDKPQNAIGMAIACEEYGARFFAN